MHHCLTRPPARIKPGEALSGAGFCIYGPQAMTGLTAVNLATKRFAGTAVGFTSLFSYGSVLFSGWGMGFLAERTGSWTAPFAVGS